jgi:CBS domain-containing membrane protein
VKKTVGDLMRKDFVSIQPTDSLLDAERIMRLARIRHLPVLDGSNLVGVLTHRDVLENAIAAIDDTHPEEKLEHLRGVPVEQVMAREPVTATTDLPLADAAVRMLRHKIGCLPVVEPSEGAARAIGLVTESDLVRAAYVPNFADGSD